MVAATPTTKAAWAILVNRLCMVLFCHIHTLPADSLPWHLKPECGVVLPAQKGGKNRNKSKKRLTVLASKRGLSQLIPAHTKKPLPTGRQAPSFNIASSRGNKRHSSCCEAAVSESLLFGLYEAGLVVLALAWFYTQSK